jgi:hypothetical protein
MLTGLAWTWFEESDSRAKARTDHTEADMAKENAGRWERDLKEDPLVAALVPDPAQLPVDAAVLRGFVGKSLNEGSWRLYMDAGLTEYVEIPEAEILYARELPDGRGTAVWVPGTLTLDRVRVAATQIQAEFLSGAIAAGGLPAAIQAQGWGQSSQGLGRHTSTHASPPNSRGSATGHPSPCSSISAATHPVVGHVLID